MTLTLRLPSTVTAELEQQARRIGVSPEEHATGLLQAALKAGGDPLASAEQPSRPSAFGKYAHVPGTSDDFARRKQEEIDREDGRAA